MQQTGNRARRGLLLALSLALAGLLANPAQAGGNEFDDGFEDQLGRLVATEAFFLGKWLLAGAYHHAVHRPHPHPPAWERSDRESRDSEWDEWGVPEPREPCEVEYRERVRHDRYGEVVEYERREVCRRPVRYGRYDD